MFRYIIALLFITVAFPCFSQQDQLELIKKLNKSGGNDKESLTLLVNDSRQSQLTATLYNYAKDTAVSEHKGTNQLVRKLEQRIADKNLRKMLVHTLTEVMWNAPPEVSAQSVKIMQQFDRSDFDQAAKDDLAAFLAKNSPGRADAILLIGFIGTSSDISFLKNAAQYSKLSKVEKYKLTLAMIRLNDPESTATFVDELKQRKFNDDLAVNVLPDLIYTHNPEVYKFLFAEINNDNAQCSSANNDSDEKILCGYRIMEVIAPVITGFPVTVDKYGEISGDYEQALLKVRQWYEANKGNFTINPDNF